MTPVPPIDEPWELGGVRLPNRVALAPLAGIGNWFIRMQARRHGAGLAVSEMVSSFGIKYGDKRTLREFLRVHPDEHPVSIQLFGHDPEVMKIAAEKAREAGADLIDINMGCPVKKVVKTGAGASLLQDPDKAVAIARGAVEGSGLPVTVKLRSGLVPGDRCGLDVARRLVEDAGVAGIALHPRHASQQHRGTPDYDLARELVETLPAPVLLTGGLSSAEKALEAYERTGAAAVLLARGSLGNPWIFEQLLGTREGEPSAEEVVTELRWVIDRAEEHFGVERAGRWLRKAYPWYGERLGLPKRLNHQLCMSATTAEARVFLDTIVPSGTLSALSHA
ncbi:MAG: tRNA-dihydrouridine synthase [Thermoleophilaceae bacterium]|nr:tRNA-dihydrouridine synthase [Thermoleophilaceae bacterium]